MTRIVWKGWLTAWLLLLLVCFVAVRPSNARAPQRVISLNMCTDQLLLALGDPETILGLSRFAADPHLSYAASQAEGYPLLPASAETVIALEPDLVLTGRFTNRTTKDLLRRLGYRVEEVPFVRSVDDAQDVIELVGALLGNSEGADDLNAEIADAFIRSTVPQSMHALILQRRGYATGTASLTADLLSRLGIRLASDSLVSQRGGFADLETIVRSEPDVLILSSLEPEAEDQGAAWLSHPVLAERFPLERRMALPERLTVCPGPSLIEAAEHLARERDAFLQRFPAN
ncbi:MAG: ABC transporter substrate-binding protein [Pseudomonadota bacterium]